MTPTTDPRACRCCRRTWSRPSRRRRRSCPTRSSSTGSTAPSLSCRPPSGRPSSRPTATPRAPVGAAMELDAEIGAGRRAGPQRPAAAAGRAGRPGALSVEPGPAVCDRCGQPAQGSTADLVVVDRSAGRRWLCGACTRGTCGRWRPGSTRTLVSLPDRRPALAHWKGRDYLVRRAEPTDARRSASGHDVHGRRRLEDFRRASAAAASAAERACPGSAKPGCQRSISAR